MSKLVSVLIPVYNAKLTIRACMDSILSQTYSNFELIVYFDGSTDESNEIVSCFQDRRIKLVMQEKNIGIAAARNKLVDIANGDYIAWMDADDLMLPNRLKQQVEFLEKNLDVDICGSSALLRNSILKEKEYLPYHDLIHSCNFFKCSTLFPTVMTRNFYKEEGMLFDEAFGSRASDFEWLYRVGSLKKLVNLPFPTLSYYVSSKKELEVKKLNNNFEYKMTDLLKSKLNLLALSYPKDQILLLHNFILANLPLERNQAITLNNMLQEIRVANVLHGNLHERRSFDTIVLYLILRVKRNSGISISVIIELFKEFKWSIFFNILKYRRRFP